MSNERFFVQCCPTDVNVAKHFPNSNFAIKEILNFDSEAYPLKNVLQKLIDASEYLLHKKNYDGIDYEEIETCVLKAKQIVHALSA